MGGLLLIAVNPKSTPLFFLFGIAGGGVGLTIIAKIEGVTFEDPWQDFLMITAIALGMSYISLPGTLLALIMFK